MRFVYRHAQNKGVSMSQERKSSGNLQKGDIENFHNHNFRITKPSYLLPNEFVTLKNHTVLFHDFDTVFDEQIKIWKEKNKKGGRPPRKENCLQEIVINLKADSKIDDLITISNYIKREYDYIPLEIAIHNDEGFVDKNGKAHYNYHAHIDFCTLNNGIQWCQMEHYCDKVEYTKKDGTKSWRFVSNKDSKLQDFIAETLGMERGQKGSKAKRLEHEQYRQVAQQKQVLTDQIDDLNDINNLYVKLLRSYADSFEINSGSAFEMLKEIGNKATELKELKADKEQQLKQIELLKKRRGVILKRGTEKYRAQKKALKAQISALNLKIEGLNKTIQSLTADKADLQSQLETAKAQILSDQQKADLITNAINSKLENKELYTKQAFDEKEVTKTITKTETQTVTKLRDYTEQEKQDLIDNAIKAKIEQGELYTSDDYNNKPVNLTQKMIKDYIEDNRQAMRQAGIYTASDYKQLTQLKADLISELKLAKQGELQLTNEQVKSRIKTLMSDLSAKAKKAEDDLTTATNDLATANDKIATLENENGVLTKINDMLQKTPINPATKPAQKPVVEQSKPQVKPAPKTEVVEGKYNPVLDFLENPQNCSRTIEAIGAIGKFNLDDDTTYNRIFEALSQMQIELTITDTNKTISEKLVNKYFETYPLQKKDKTIQLNNKPKTIKL